MSNSHCHVVEFLGKEFCCASADCIQHVQLMRSQIPRWPWPRRTWLCQDAAAFAMTHTKLKPAQSLMFMIMLCSQNTRKG